MYIDMPMTTSCMKIKFEIYSQHPCKYGITDQDNVGQGDGADIELYRMVYRTR